MSSRTGQGIHQRFEAQARETPDATAVIAGERTITFRALDREANRLARHLRRRGVRPEVPVAICLPRSTDAIVALLAVLKAGGGYVPVDPALPPARLDFVLGDVRAAVVLTNTASAPVTDVAAVRLDADAGEIASESGGEPGRSVRREEPRLRDLHVGVFWAPKGVGCAHRAVLNLLADAQAASPVRPGARCSWWASLSFDASVAEIFGALLFGGTVVVVPDEVRADPPGYVAWMSALGIESAFLLPSFLGALIEHEGPCL